MTRYKISNFQLKQLLITSTSSIFHYENLRHLWIFRILNFNIVLAVKVNKVQKNCLTYLQNVAIKAFGTTDLQAACERVFYDRNQQS